MLSLFLVFFISVCLAFWLLGQWLDWRRRRRLQRLRHFGEVDPSATFKRRIARNGLDSMIGRKR